jgi:hypothetical protein
MDMDAAKLGTTMQRWIHLTGIEKMAGIECTFNALLLIHIIFREHRTHEIAFLNADAMFAGQYTTDLDTDFKNFSAKFFGRFQLTWLIGIIQNQRVKITVTGMKNIRNTETVFCFQRPNSFQYK